MKKDFHQNIFLFSNPSQFLKLSFCKKPFFLTVKNLKSSNVIFGVSQPASFGLVPVKSDFVPKDYSPLMMIALAPI